MILRPVEREILLARELHSSIGLDTGEDDELPSLLREYEEAIQQSQLMMEREGVARGCGICARSNPGGCCFPGVEEWYDPILLSINLLLGNDLPRAGEIPSACYFVGSNGCRLLARHSFCINYFCPDLKLRLTGRPQERLNAATGRELLCGWRVEQKIRSRLGKAWK